MTPTTFRSLAGLALASILAAVPAVGDEQADQDTAKPTTPALTGVAAGMHFTDAQGNPRAPTPAERANLAAAFQRDLEALRGGRAVPRGSRRERSGAVSAVVGAERLQFLTVTIDEDGKTKLGHGDASGQPPRKAGNALPEK